MKRYLFYVLQFLFFLGTAFGIQIDLVPLNRTINSVSLQTVEKIAKLKIAHRWNVSSFSEPIPMSDPAGNLNAYMFCFSFSDNTFPSFENLVQSADIPLSDIWHTGEYGYIIVSAVKTMPPILDIADCLPPYYATLSRALQKAKQTLSGNEPKLVGIFFLSTSSVWFKFENESGCVYINSYRPDLEKTQDQWNDYFADWVIPRKVFPSWANFDGEFETEAFDVIDYGRIDGVPAYLWSFGCAPTSSAMVFGYWNERGYGMLIDYFYDHYDVVTHTTVPNVPNVQCELAIAMDTDTLETGGTNPDNMPAAHLVVANDINGYSFESRISPNGSPTNHFNWSWILDEVNVYNRPFVWAVLSYYDPSGRRINHATTGYGYEVDAAGDSLVIIHNTWDNGEHSWPLYTLGTSCPCDDSWDIVITIEPAGGTGISINILTPTRGDNLIGYSDVTITWETIDTLYLIDHIGIDYTTDNGETWEDIVSSTPDDGSYIWTLPSIDISTIARIRIRAYSDDGTLLSVNATGNLILLAASNVSCVSYLPVGFAYTEHSDVMVIDSVLFTADYSNGIGEVKISDPNHPVEVARYFDTHGDAVALWAVDSLVYVASYSTAGGGIVVLNRNFIRDTLSSSPVFPDTLVELSWYTDIHKAMDIQVQGNYAYVIDADWGLRVLDVSNPIALRLVGYWGTYSPATYQGIFIRGNYAYITMGYQGIKILDMSSLDAITEIGSYDTDGYSIRCFLYDDILYVADGWFGDLLLFDVSDPTLPELLGSYNTGGYVRDVKSNGIRAFIADMNEGFLCLDITNPLSITCEGYMQIGGSAQAVDFRDTLAFVTARNDGLYIIDFSDISSIEESPSVSKPESPMIMLSPNPFNSHQKIIIENFVHNDIISFDIYSITGKCVRNLQSNNIENSTENKNISVVEWDGCNNNGIPLSSGVYFIRVKTQNNILIRKTILLK
ncbi:T9SS type A sorting domain-containing protein [bacterium]|nr:T9SS type A sorting domain-containing protein [bacterium]